MLESCQEESFVVPQQDGDSFTKTVVHTEIGAGRTGVDGSLCRSPKNQKSQKISL